MKTKLTLVLVAASLAACGGGHPGAPGLGAQIDRMGRPAVNTALTNPFDTLPGKTSDQAKDEYNAATDPAGWSAAFKSEIAGNLAILDALDGVCGNQLAAKPASGGAVPPDRYSALAGVLADDQLYVDTRSGTCQLYLALEADATGLAPGNGDCGGRTPLENVIDETYSLLAIGRPSGVKQNVDRDGDGAASLTAFPFLSSPN